MLAVERGDPPAAHKAQAKAGFQADTIDRQRIDEHLTQFGCHEQTRFTFPNEDWRKGSRWVTKTDAPLILWADNAWTDSF
jgi:hypothetical protein